MCNNQELLYLVVISFILVTLMSDSGLIQQGEIRCLSLLGCKGLRLPYHSYEDFMCLLILIGIVGLSEECGISYVSYMYINLY